VHGPAEDHIPDREDEERDEVGRVDHVRGVGEGEETLVQGRSPRARLDGGEHHAQDERHTREAATRARAHEHGQDDLRDQEASEVARLARHELGEEPRALGHVVVDDQGRRTHHLALENLRHVGNLHDFRVEVPRSDCLPGVGFQLQALLAAGPEDRDFQWIGHHYD